MPPSWFRILKAELEYRADKNEEETNVNAFFNDKKVGFILTGHPAILREKMNAAIIQDTLVEPEHRRKGIGKGLYEKLLEELPADVHELKGTAQDNAAASFWQGLGFTLDGNKISKRIR